VHVRIELGLLMTALGVSACFNPDDSTAESHAMGSTSGSGNDDASTSRGPSTSSPSSSAEASSNTEASSSVGPSSTAEASSTAEPSGVTTTDETTSASETGTSNAGPLCATVYHDWLTSDFAFPDHGAVGITVLPGTPWGHAAGSPTVEGQALVASATSTVVASQGDILPKEGVRLRFQVSFHHADNRVEVGFNGDDTGVATTSVILRAADGAFVITDGSADAAAMLVGPLELGIEYFVELELDVGGGVARLAINDYAIAPGSTIVAELDLGGGLGAANLGRYTSATVVPSGGLSPRIEEVSLARCGLQPGGWTDVLVDEFDRAALQGPDLPDTSVWTGDATGMTMGGGAVRLDDAFTIGVQAATQTEIGNDHARLRALVRFQQATAWPTLYWGVTATHGAADPEFGCVLWNNGDEGRIIVQSYNAGTELPDVGRPYETDTPYYLEMSVDGDYAVCSVRTESFAGPVKFAVADDSAAAPAGTAGYAGFGNSASGSYYIDEMRLSRFTP